MMLRSRYILFGFGGLVLAFLVLVIIGATIAHRQGEVLRSGLYESTGISSVQILVHYESLLKELVRHESRHEDAQDAAVTQFDILYERMENLLQRPDYEAFIDGEMLREHALIMAILTAELPNIDSAADGNPEALRGSYKRLSALAPLFSQFVHKPVQKAAEARFELRDNIFRITEQLILVIAGLTIAGVIFSIVIFYQLSRSERRRKELDQSRHDLEQTAKKFQLLRDVAVASNSAREAREAYREVLDLVTKLSGCHAGVVLEKSSPHRSRFHDIDLWIDPLRVISASDKAVFLDLVANQACPVVNKVLSQEKVCWLAGQSDSGIASFVKIAVPVTVEGEIIALLLFFSIDSERPDEDFLDLLSYIGDPLGQAIERSRIGESLRASKEEAEAANTAKSLFLATMSHEIRTPLNGVLGMATLLQGTPLSTTQKDFVQTLQQSGQALLALINDILDYSKIEAGRLELESIDFDLANTVESTLSLLGAKAHEKGIDISSHVSPALPTRLRGDAGRLRQILLNLIGNAIKFTDKGGVSLRVNTLGVQDNWVRVEFTVADSGIGIAKENLGKLFDKFVQADASTTRKYGGTGLGLSISKQLVDAMGGTITCKSELGKGTTFTFEIWLEILEAENAIDWDLLRSSLEGKQALVVDHCATRRPLIEESLRDTGLMVESAEPHPLLIQQMELMGADIIVIDERNLKACGFTGAKDMQALVDRLAEKIVILSTNGNGPASQQNLFIKAQILLKPMRTTHLLRCLDCYFELNLPSQAAWESPGAQVASNEVPTTLRILLAEDNAINQMFATKLLESAGHIIDVAANGREAIDMLYLKPYDIVLMDVQMPELDGLEATREIRAAGGSMSNIPIIAMTANALQGDRETCLAAGMNDYISKPIDQAELFAKIVSYARGGIVTETPQDDKVCETWPNDASVAAQTPPREGKTEEQSPEDQFEELFAEIDLLAQQN